MDEQKITVTQVNPRLPSIVMLIEELDRHLGQLYPAESNYLMDLDALSAPDVRFFAANEGDDVLGCGAIKLFDEYAEVKRVYVTARARGRGVAMRILRALEDATRDAGLRVMRLETGVFQPDAIALFEKVEFRRCSSFGDYPKSDPYSVFMERHLP